MKVEQSVWTAEKGWQSQNTNSSSVSDAQIVFMFGGVNEIEASDAFRKLHEAYPKAHICGCSTAGEITGTQVLDNSVVVTAVEFENAKIRTACIDVPNIKVSYDAGARLANQFPEQGLKHIFVLGDGLDIGKSELIAGMNSTVPEGVTISGGYAGDHFLWSHTYVWGGGAPKEKTAIGIGFYGDHLRVGVASAGGWDAFGPERAITRLDGRVVYEFDGQNALNLYKQYLGEHASGLPATGLMFPLSLRDPNSTNSGMLRVVENVDEKNGSLIMGGYVPPGSVARMMSGNKERLIDGARNAAVLSKNLLAGGSAQLALIISCGGRRPILKHRIDEEVEAAADVLGSQATITGFYSYGEIAPIDDGSVSVLHNQTFAVVSFSEI